MMLGVGYRHELSGWIASTPAGVDCLEITAEHFFGGGLDRLQTFAKNFPLFVHGLGLSLGTPGPLDPKRLAQFTCVVQAANPQWVSEHVAFTRTEEVNLGHLNPLPPTRNVLDTVADHAREMADVCGKPILLENITSHLPLTGEMAETDFLNQLCERAECGLLLDVTNLFINSRNHGFDPLKWLRELEPHRIVQLHLVGYSRSGDRYTDSHSMPIQPELLELARAVVDCAPVKAVVLERDENFPAASEWESEIAKLERLRARY
ncbi:MAG TPA: DUF692 domain-containing protein [Verrucomicrobiota bacterium]|nr:hypothetical protein [Verrucomicrobiales bacterium]HRI13300.1 DUF692 domain-containing protein [Verrucomicrobiota bacterium]